MREVRLTPRLIRGLREVTALGGALLKDVEFAREKVVELLLSSARESPEESELPNHEGEEESTKRKGSVFWIKTAIRSLFGLVDGLSYAMRRTVFQNAGDAGLVLSTKERARLQERRYDSKTDTVLATPQFLSPADSFKLAFRLFPRLFGSEFVLDTGGEEWHAVRRLIDVRNAFTHPKFLEDLSIHPALPAFGPGIDWIYRQVAILFQEVSVRIGGNSTGDLPAPSLPKFRESEAPWQKVYSDDDYLRIEEYGGRTLDYVGVMFSMLHDETSLAAGLCNGSFSMHGLLLSPRSQFAFRTLTRTLFSQVEGVTSAIRFFVVSAAKRSEIAITSEDLAIIDVGEIEDRFVAALNLWSREFGNGMVIAKDGESWKHFRGARAFRDRITHPRGLESVKVDLKLTETLLGAFGFSANAWEATYLDPEKWAAVSKGIEEAVRDREGDPLTSTESEEVDAEEAISLGHEIDPNG